MNDRNILGTSSKIAFLLLCAMARATELPAPFTSYATTSTSGGDFWDIGEEGVSGDIYAGRVMLSSLSSSVTLKFDGAPGTLKLRCTNYAGDNYSLLGSSRYYAWLNNGQVVGSWYSTLDGVSYAENSLSCRFDEYGEHSLVLSLSMQKQSSKYYVQGPRLTVHHLEWLPDYVDFSVAGDTVRVDGDWIRRNISSNVLVDCRYDYAAALNTIGDNGYTIIDSYVAGLTPTNSSSKLLANIHVVNGASFITWTPNLDSRVYTIYGKTNLTDKAWHSPTNEASRFFKVGVEMR